jgi:elongation factor Ts
MAEVNAQLVKKLRDLTGVSIQKCRDVLVETQQGSHADEAAWIDAARDVLRKIGLSAGAKKSDRETKEGLIVTSENGKAIAIVEGNCESDFVSSNADFKKFMDGVAEEALKHDSSESFKSAVEVARNEAIQKIGENIVIGRSETIHKKPHSSYGIYNHQTKGRVVVIVEVEGCDGQTELARDIAMHVASASPEFLSEAEISKEFLAKEKEIAAESEKVMAKPEAIREKIVAGMMKARIDEVCLVNQKFIKDPNLTVQQYVDSVGKAAGKTLHVRRFWRWAVGQS